MDADMIPGRNPVREALENPEIQVEKVLVQQGLHGKAIEAILKAAATAGVPVQHVPPQKFNRQAPGLNHQGVLALVAPVKYLELEEMLAGIAADTDVVRQNKPILVLLDQIEDPQNFGAIIRSAVAAGVAGMIVPRHHMAPLTAAAIKASAGTALRMPLARVTNLADTISQLKERGYWVVGAEGEAELSVWEMDWDRPLAIVIGSEGAGLRQRVRDSCDYLVRIPIPGDAESLNASVAAGIILFAAVRQTR
jgi:23S rRNA (guanosine2251-2'-O)-methyltransferase